MGIVFYFDKHWSCEKYWKDSVGVLKKRWINLKNIDSVYYQLAVNNVFSLPDPPSNLSNEYFIPEDNTCYAEGGQASEGDWYKIDFKVGDGFRSYGFGRPNDFINYPSYNEGKNYLAIANIIKQLCKASTNGK